LFQFHFKFGDFILFVPRFTRSGSYKCLKIPLSHLERKRGTRFLRSDTRSLHNIA